MRRGSIQLLYLEEGRVGPDADIKYTVNMLEDVSFRFTIQVWCSSELTALGNIFRGGRRRGGAR